MPDARYPTRDEFFQRLDRRDVEPDLRDTLRARAATDHGTVERVGDPATVVAVMERLLPGADVPASVLAAFVDQNYDRQLGRGDERAGILPRAQLIPLGFAILDRCAPGASFGSLNAQAADDLLRRAEEGSLPITHDGFDSKIWFSRLRDLVLMGFGSDPRGMVQMGYPGPSYKTGHVWLTQGEIDARMRRIPGYQEL